MINMTAVYDEQRPVIEAALHWAQLMAAEAVWSDAKHEADDVEWKLKNTDLMRAGIAMAEDRYRRMLTTYVGDKIESQKRHDQLEQELSDLVHGLRGRNV